MSFSWLRRLLFLLQFSGAVRADEALEQLPSEPTISAINIPPRCANREEWRGECRLWSGKPHHRYIQLTELTPREGVGASLLRVAWVLHRAIAFDLEPVFDGPFIAGHKTGSFGEWMGFERNPMVALEDPAGYEDVEKQIVPLPKGNEDAWFLSQMNRTSVVFTPDIMKVTKAKEWGVLLASPVSNVRICPSVAMALSSIFWSVPEQRDRCRSVFAQQWGQEEEGKGGAFFYTDIPGQDADARPWVVAVHVRRGDMVAFRGGVRSVPHAYFVAVVRSSLMAIAAADPGAQVNILVFSEGPGDLPAQNRILNEHSYAVEWNIPRDDCQAMGLSCRQGIFFSTSFFNTFDCLAAADIVVGSESSMSEAIAAVSTNVKVMLWEDQIEQDRITLNSAVVASADTLSLESQEEMNHVIAEWRHCATEARGATGDDPLVTAARNFYQTVDG